MGAFRQDSPRVDPGAAYLFRNLDTAIGTVSQNAKLIVPAAQPMDFFGTAISLSGTTGLVGAAQASQGFGLPRGAAYYFRNLDTASGTVTPQVTLTPSPQPPDSRFGFSVSHSASVAVVGAPFADSSATQQGIAYVFRNLDTASGIVNQQLTLLASDASAMAQFGWSVSQSGTRALVGAPGVNSGTGAAYIFSELDSSGGTRTQQAKLVAFDQVQDDLFGQSVSLSGGLGLVGAVGAGEGRGAAYLFRNLETATGTLNAAIKITASDGAASRLFGASVSFAGDGFLIGASGKFTKGGAFSGSVAAITSLDIGNSSKTISGISFTSREDWTIGQSTDANQVTLGAGDVANVTASGRAIYIGRNAGSDNNKLIVEGTVTSSQIQIGGTGTTGNSVEVNTTGFLDATAINVSIGGTLRLTGSNTDNDRLLFESAITIENGGTFATSGLREGNTTIGAPSAIGLLTLAAGSTLDFAAGANGSSILTNRIATAGTGTISIRNWSGTARRDDSDPGSDRLLFFFNPQFTAAQLAQFQFYNDNNVPFARGAIVAGYSGFSELVPVPEPSLVVPLIALAGFLRFRARADFTPGCGLLFRKQGRDERV